MVLLLIGALELWGSHNGVNIWGFYAFTAGNKLWKYMCWGYAESETVAALSILLYLFHIENKSWKLPYQVRDGVASLTALAVAENLSKARIDMLACITHRSCCLHLFWWLWSSNLDCKRGVTDHTANPIPPTPRRARVLLLQLCSSTVACFYSL